VDWTFHGIIIIGLIIIWYMTPKFNDIFYIREEMKLIIVQIFLGIIISAIDTAVGQNIFHSLYAANMVEIVYTAILYFTINL